jgi:hypothetical protein
MQCTHWSPHTCGERTSQQGGPWILKNVKSVSLYDHDPSTYLVVFHDVLAVVWMRLSILTDADGNRGRGIAREIKLYSCGLAYSRQFAQIHTPTLQITSLSYHYAYSKEPASK